jgi:hypothetical protein
MAACAVLGALAARAHALRALFVSAAHCELYVFVQ